MIDAALIKKLAALSRLELDDKEIETLSREAGSILDYAASLHVLDISEVPPMTHAEPLENVMREDAAIEADKETRSSLLGQLATSKDNQLKVPNVFGNSDPS